MEQGAFLSLVPVGRGAFRGRVLGLYAEGEREREIEGEGGGEKEQE